MSRSRWQETDLHYCTTHEGFLDVDQVRCDFARVERLQSACRTRTLYYRRGSWGGSWTIHNLIAHPMLVLCPPLGAWLHDRTAPKEAS